MAGSVGGAVAGCPGYAGYVPSSQQPLPCINSLITERLPVARRRLASQVKPAVGRGSAATTDSLSVSTGVQPVPPGHSVNTRKRPESAPAHRVPRDCSVYFLPKRVPCASVYAEDSQRGADPEAKAAGWQYPRSKAKLLLGSMTQRSGSSADKKEPFTAKTLCMTKEQNVAEDRNPRFWSEHKMRKQAAAEARQEEQKRATRSSGRGAVEGASSSGPGTCGVPQPRAAWAAEDVCPNTVFKKQERRPLLGAELVNASEFVKFMGGGGGGGIGMSTAQVDYGVRGAAPQDRMGRDPRELSDNATTMDLCQGTPRATRGLRLPGYVGHVPAVRANLMRIHGRPEDDLVRQNARNCILLSSGSRTMPGYSGFEPKSVNNDTGMPNRPPPATSAASVQHAAQAGEREKAMNHPDFAKNAGIRRFFTQGGGMTDHTIADQYFVKYRPMEGLLKMGAPADRNIPAAR